jgi:GAF domain-containing protein
VVIGDPHVRFYAGIPLHAADGARVGAFCIVDSKPRSLSPVQLRMLKDIARLIEGELEPRRGEGRLLPASFASLATW